MTAPPIAESPQSGTLLTGERHVLELIATGAPLGDVLDALCRVIDEQSGLMSAVFLLDRDGKQLTLAAGPHLPDAWRQAIRSFAATPTTTACGAAVSGRRQVIVPDVLASPLYADWHEAARASRIGAIWSTPFYSNDGRVLGTFAVNDHESRRPDDAQLGLVDRATHLASIAVERHQTEEALRESERRFSHAFHANPACMTITRFSDGRLLYVNDAFVKLFGYSRAEAIGQTDLSLGLYADPLERPRLMQLLAERRLHNVEARGRTKSGDTLDVVLSMERVELLGEDSVLAIATDITDRKRSEDALRESEERLRRSEHLLAEAQRLAHIGSWNWDLPGRTVTWSDELYRIFGFQPLEIDPAREAMAFVHVDDLELVTSAITTTFATKEPYSFFYRIRRRDGSERILRSTGHLVCNEHGEPVSVFGTTQDMTERKQAEDALQRGEQLLRLVLDALPVGVAVLDLAGDVILSNPAARRIWSEVIPSGRERYARSQAWRHDTREQLAPEEWASARALAHGDTSVNEVLDIEAFDGVRKVIQNSAVPIRDASGRITGAVVVNEDISAEKAVERELNDSFNQMRTLTGRLMRAQDDERRRIAQILHETTAQDLAALKMHLARLARTGAGVSDSDRAALTESIELAERSMTGIRTLSYLLHPPFLDEAGLLSALRWYAAGFGERSGIEVELDLPQTFERLPQDVETTLFRVVQEALINIHRHAESPTALIRLAVDCDRLTLEIKDRGRGMPAETIAQLSTGGSALGVGVAGMHERLQQLGGTLHIESGDRGTTVRAQIPLPPDAR